VARTTAVALGQFCTTDVTTVAEVVDRLAAIREASAEDVTSPDKDGISCFSRLYHRITVTVLEATERRSPSGITFEDNDFLTELDLQFARRYLDAIRVYAAGEEKAPRSWDVLFAQRDDQEIGHVNFASAGVNAHVNFDLTFALLETWKKFPPSALRRRDYDQVNKIFAYHMDGLRDDFGAFLSGVGREDGPIDVLGNMLSNMLVRVTRSAAWDEAAEVWEHYDSTQDGGGPRYRKAYEETHDKLDGTAHLWGWMILKAPDIP
jgi:hypothetical protein